jgi:hypothetical protein
MCPQTPITATLTPKTDYRGHDLSDDEQQQARVTAHYNPDTLKFSVSTQVKKEGRNQPVQVVSKTTAKLSFELIFDTTTRGGGDVRQTTWKIIQMMAPEQQGGRRRGRRSAANKPVKVEFAWGSSIFLGYIDSLKENLDFFNSAGIPLRSTVSISMSENTLSFAPLEADEEDGAEEPLGRSLPGMPLDQAAGTQGNSAVTRMIGAANGLDSIRNPAALDLKISPPSLKISPPLVGAEANFSASMQSFAGLRGQGMATSSSAPMRLRPQSPPCLEFAANDSRPISSSTEFLPGGRIVGEADENGISGYFESPFNRK